nr:MAG TPA: hypothetical protein [Caudoviricetes sp.]
MRRFKNIFWSFWIKIRRKNTFKITAACSLSA